MFIMATAKKISEGSKAAALAAALGHCVKWTLQSFVWSSAGGINQECPPPTSVLHTQINTHGGTHMQINLQFILNRLSVYVEVIK